MSPLERIQIPVMNCFTLKITIPSLCLSPHSFSSISLFMCKYVLDRGGGRERKSERMNMCFPQRLYHVYMYRVHQKTTSTRVWQGRIIINPLCTLYQLVQKLHTSSVSTDVFPQVIVGFTDAYCCVQFLHALWIIWTHGVRIIS